MSRAPGAGRLAWLLLAVVPGSCVAPPESRFSQSPVTVGMSREQVRGVFGNPLRTVGRQGGGEAWFYPLTYEEVREEVHDEHLRTGDGSLGFPKEVRSAVWSTAERSPRRHEASVDFDAAGRVEAVPRGVVRGRAADF